MVVYRHYLLTWIVILKLALRAANNDIFAPPREFLNERAKIGQRY